MLRERNNKTFTHKFCATFFSSFLGRSRRTRKEIRLGLEGSLINSSQRELSEGLAGNSYLYLAKELAVSAGIAWSRSVLLCPLLLRTNSGGMCSGICLSRSSTFSIVVPAIQCYNSLEEEVR